MKEKAKKGEEKGARNEGGMKDEDKKVKAREM